MSSLSESIKESFRNQGTHLATSDVRFSRILIGTDFSRPAARALQLAVAIAATFNSEIYIVHAVQPLLYGDGQTPMPVEILNAQFEAAKHDINQLVSSEPRLAGLRFRTAVDYGGALDLINRVAKEEKVTLIVLGSHEASGFEKVMLGSVSETVLRRSSCPVLIVGPNCHVESYPFRSILFATDLKTTGLRAAQYASALAEHVDGRLTLLHVIEKRPEKPGFDLDLYEKGLREKLGCLLPPDVESFCSPNIRLEYGLPGRVITDIAKSEASSLIVVGVQDRSAMADRAPWTTLSHVIREASCGVLAIRGHLN